MSLIPPSKYFFYKKHEKNKKIKFGQLDVTVHSADLGIHKKKVSTVKNPILRNPQPMVLKPKGTQIQDSLGLHNKMKIRLRYSNPGFT